MEDLQIILHIIELCLFLFMLFWVSQRNSRFIQRQPFKIMAILTIFTTILGGVALCIFDIILFGNHFANPYNFAKFLTSNTMTMCDTVWLNKQYWASKKTVSFWICLPLSRRLSFTKLINKFFCSLFWLI